MLWVVSPLGALLPNLSNGKNWTRYYRRCHSAQIFLPEVCKLVIQISYIFSVQMWCVCPMLDQPHTWCSNLNWLTFKNFRFSCNDPDFWLLLKNKQKPSQSNNTGLKSSMAAFSWGWVAVALFIHGLGPPGPTIPTISEVITDSGHVSTLLSILQLASLSHPNWSRHLCFQLLSSSSRVEMVWYKLSLHH